ncbi:siderophore-interacting protein [Lentzea sp. NBRC 105346]|uniref:RNA polymerase sigma factor n=1 Tax=Lentzea sp. NBRC 105346 TaxID=3032205 RepID=UPI0024A01C4D|nr:RNA polymerase sigma factor [Lentzea sp. NBRC 105346]GLZ33061.1 siderophore-interacting protein [Lentzea sp. NBRC 105346]
MSTDRERFQAVYLECYPRVLAYAASRVGRAPAEDVTSETFTIAWRKLGDMPANALPWLLGIARNLVRQSHREVVWQELPEVAEPDSTGVVELLDALNGLSESDREVLTLVAWHGLSSAEAAQVLDCSTATFFVRLHRARGRLKRAFSQSRPRVAAKEKTWT